MYQAPTGATDLNRLEHVIDSKLKTFKAELEFERWQRIFWITIGAMWLATAIFFTIAIVT